MDKKANEEMFSKLVNYARGIVEGKTKEEAGKVLERMKERFTFSFNHDDSDSIPRIWTGKEDIRTLTKTSRSSSLKLLSGLAATRLDLEDDKIGDTLVRALMDHKKDISNSTPLQDPLASSTWEKIPAADTFITPVQCKSLWNQFQRETEDTITQAIASQEANKHKNKWLLPPCALAALLILGFTGISSVLRIPLFLFVIVVGYLLFKGWWARLDIPSEFRNIMFPGNSLSTRVYTIVTNLLRNRAEEGQEPVTTDSLRNLTNRPIGYWVCRFLWDPTRMVP